MIEKNLAKSGLGQHHCLNWAAIPAQGLQHNRWAVRSEKDAAPKKWQARPFVGDVERPSLKFEPEFMKLRLAEDERWPGGCRNAQGAPTTTVGRIALLRGL
jgi:hypothetical protein